MIRRYKSIPWEIAEHRPQTILEVGVWRGIRAKEMIMVAQQVSPLICYYGFDLFENMTADVKEKELHAKANAKKAEAESNIKSCDCEYELIIGNTRDTLPKFKPQRAIDFVFIDGGHSIGTIQSDWDCISKLMHARTLVIFDDYYENRDDVGCRTLIDNLPDKYQVTKMDPIDSVNGLKIRLVKVRHK